MPKEKPGAERHDAAAGRPSLAAAGWRAAVVVSRFNSEVTSSLEAGAVAALRNAGLRAEDVAVLRVPGAFEIPPAARRAAHSGRYDAVVCIGAVIRGQTDHYEHVARAVVDGTAAVALEAAGLPRPVAVTLGVLTTATVALAKARAGGDAGNKGAEAAEAALEVAALWRGGGT